MLQVVAAFASPPREHLKGGGRARVEIAGAGADRERPALDLLVVEDNPADQRLVIEAFRESGIPVTLTFAVDGAQAIEALRERGEDSPDAVLLDLNLPRMDGRQFLRAVREEKSIPRPRVIVLSTSTSPQDRSAAWWAAAYIPKPARFEDFVTAVRKIALLCLTPN